jgi:hypothetical protein
MIASSSLDPLRGYQGEDIEIQLPGNLTVYDIDWLAVWCVQYRHNFGHVLIPKDLDVPPAMGQTKITVSMADTLVYQLLIPLRTPGLSLWLHLTHKLIRSAQGTYVRAATAEEIGHCLSVSAAFLSINGIKCSIPKDERTDFHIISSSDHLRK